jgi:hypothetical protein
VGVVPVPLGHGVLAPGTDRLPGKAQHRQVTATGTPPAARSRTSR